MSVVVVVVIAVLAQTSSVRGLSSISLSLKKPIFVSSGSAPGRTVDGNPDSRWTGSSCWEASGGDMDPYWMVDLQGVFPITHVAITNRVDCCPERLHDIEIVLYNENPEENPEASSSLCNFYPGPVGAGVTQIIPCTNGNLTSRFLRLNGLARRDTYDRFTMCEVSVLHLVSFSKRVNLARGKPSTASSGQPGRISAAVDGNANSDFMAGYCWESQGDPDPYWMVDLQQEYQVGFVAVTNGADCCAERLHDIGIVLYNENPEENPEAFSTLCNFYPGPVGAGLTQVIPCSENVNARFVKIIGLKRRHSFDFFTLCEVSVSSEKCLKIKFTRVKRTRMTGTFEVLHNLSKLSCLSACTHNFYCVGFNYGDGASCQTVTVPETVTESPGWSFYKLANVDS